MAGRERDSKKPEYKLPISRERDKWIPISIGVAGVSAIVLLTFHYAEQEVSASQPPAPVLRPILPTRVPTPVIHFENIPMQVNPHRYQRRRSADFDAQD